MNALLDQNKTSGEATEDAVDFIGEWRLAIPPSGACAMSGLGQNRKSSVGLGMSASGGKAEVNFGRLEVRL